MPIEDVNLKDQEGVGMESPGRNQLTEGDVVCPQDLDYPWRAKERF